MANPEKPGCQSLLLKAAKLIRRADREVLTDRKTARLARMNPKQVFETPAQLARACDLLLIFGGDGTMLNFARAVGGSATPLLGINIGRLGFLTEVASRKFDKALEEIWKGNCRLESRPLIEAVIDKPEGRQTQLALNDFVVSRGIISRMIELEISVNGEMLTQYRGDGLIISSPTGSTAYSIAAGGPIVSPSADVFTLTPICPHTLSNRSVIVSLRSVVQVKTLSEKLETVMTADGQVPCDLEKEDRVQIRKSRHSVRLLRLENSSFFETLRQKLQWKGSNV